jgi:hypothetical protein
MFECPALTLAYFNISSFSSRQHACQHLVHLEHVSELMALGFIADVYNQLSQPIVNVHFNIVCLHQIIGLAYFFLRRFSNSSYSISPLPESSISSINFSMFIGNWNYYLMMPTKIFALI